MANGVREPGEFCWFNILTAEPPRARELFGKVLGWTFLEIPGVGHTVAVDGQPVGGLFDVVSPQTPKGTRPVIVPMVKVASADAAAEKVRAGGGKAQAPFDVGGNLRMAVCHDPAGAAFDLWEPKGGRGTEVNGDRHGAPGGFELRTPDAKGAAAFYGGVFGWTAKPGKVEGRGVFERGGAPAGGWAPPGKGRVEWVTLFTVRDAGRVIEEAAGQGATVRSPLAEVPGVGRVCELESAQGLAFRLVERAR